MKINSLLDNMGLITKIMFNKLLNKKYPIAITYICTYRCNFRCKYCSVYKNKEKEMTTGEVMGMMDQLKNIGTRRFSFNGGEPLLRKDIKKLIDYSKSKGFITTMFTNGALVKENIHKLRNLDIMLISFDGPEKIHDEQRFKGAYNKVIEAIKIAKKNKINVWTNTVITKDNLDHIDFILKKAKELGFLTIFQPVINYPHASDKKEILKLSPTLEKYEKVIDKLIKLKKKNYPIFHSLSYLKHIKKPNWQINKRKCLASKLYCAITPGGNVAPCYPIFKNQKWPNGLELGFKKAFNSLKNFTCNGCYCILAENDFLFSLHPEVIYNTIKYF